jgi:hypothetical protein
MGWYGRGMSSRSAISGQSSDGSTSARVLGSVSCYSELHEIMRNRALELQFSRELLDERSGLNSGYSSKLLAPRPLRIGSFATLSLLLPALGIKLVAVEDVEALERLKGRAKPRGHAGAKQSAPITVHQQFSRRYLRRIAKQGGENSRKNMSKAKARALGRRAALARWRGNGAAHHTAP